jgi:hypothetical protein
MKRVIPKFRLLTYQEAAESGTQIRSIVLEYNDNNYHLEGGIKDTVHVFSQSICLYVLTINKGLGYVGFNCYMTPEPDPINSIFLQTQRDINDALGKRWEQLSPRTIVDKLINYLI